MNLTVLALHYILFFVLLHGQLKPTCKISHQKHAVLPVFPWQFLLGSFYIFTTVAVLRLELVLSMWYFIFGICTSRCPSLCRAVSYSGMLRRLPRVRKQARITFAVAAWAPGEDPAPACETGSTESGDHTQLPLHSHRSASAFHSIPCFSI